MREVAAHAILELAEGEAERLPEAWRSGEAETMRALANLRSTPVAEAAIEQFEAWIPTLRERGLITQSPGAVEVYLRRRHLIRRAYAALAERRSLSLPGPGSAATAPLEWTDVMTFDLDRHVWLAIRRTGVAEAGLEGGNARRRRVFALVRWADVFEMARQTVRLRDSREQFGLAIHLTAPGLSVQQEEPAGVECWQTTWNRTA